MKLTSIQSITDFMTCAGRTLPDNIRLWARRNLAVARSHEVSQEERRHAQRALSIMMNTCKLHVISGLFLLVIIDLFFWRITCKQPLDHKLKEAVLSR